jgi:hypothetical protein
MAGSTIGRRTWEILHRLLKNHEYVGGLFEELIRDRLRPGPL